MLGEKLKLARIENNMTLRELSKKVGISPGFISQVERNKAKPSINTLRKIANFLNTTIVYFLMDDEEEHLITRKDDRKIIKLANSKIIYELLNDNLKTKKMEAILMTIDPTYSEGEPVVFHKGEELDLVLTGEAKIVIGDQSYILKEGDNIYFNCSIPHNIFSNNNLKVKILSVISPPSF